MIYDDGIGVGRHRCRTETPKETLGIAVPPQMVAEGVVRFVPIVDAELLHEGETLRVEIGDVVVVIAESDGEVFAFQEFCTHRFGPLSEGRVEHGIVQCPWHRCRPAPPSDRDTKRNTRDCGAAANGCRWNVAARADCRCRIAARRGNVAS